MERQTKITKEIKELTNKQALLFVTIKMNSNYHDGQSEIAVGKLVKLTSIPESTIKKKRPELLKSGIFTERNYFTDQWGHSRIRYHMNCTPENYFRLKNDYLKDEKLNPNEKGFLLKLKCLTLNNTNLIAMNITNIRRELNVGKNSKLVDILIDKGYVLKFDSTHFYILNTNILFTSHENRETIYRTIETFCIDKKIIPPPYDTKKLNKILLKYTPCTFKEFLSQKCNAFIKGDLYKYIFSIITPRRPPIKEDNLKDTVLTL